jgi:hypothetical protein
MNTFHLTRRITLCAGGLAIIGMSVTAGCAAKESPAPTDSSPTSVTSNAISPTENAIRPTAKTPGPSAKPPSANSPAVPSALPSPG